MHVSGTDYSCSKTVFKIGTQTFGSREVLRNYVNTDNRRRLGLSGAQSVRNNKYPCYSVGSETSTWHVFMQAGCPVIQHVAKQLHSRKSLAVSCSMMRLLSEKRNKLTKKRFVLEATKKSSR